MPRTMSRSYKTWLKRITVDREVKQAQAVHLARLTNPQAIPVYAGYTGMTRQEVELAWELIRMQPVPFDTASVRKGLRWLERLALTPGGRLRRSSPFSPRETRIIMGADRTIYLCGVSYERPEYLLETSSGSFKYRVVYTRSDAMTGNWQGVSQVEAWDTELRNHAP